MAFGMETKQAQPAKKPDAVKRIQDIAAAEAKKKREAEAAKKKNPGVNTAPSKGVLGRMYDYVMGEKKEK